MGNPAGRAPHRATRASLREQDHPFSAISRVSPRTANDFSTEGGAAFLLVDLPLPANLELIFGAGRGLLDDRI